MNTFIVKTHGKCSLTDITERIHAIVDESGIENGIVVIFAPHTTAGITINENADPDVVSDILMKMDKIVTEDRDYRHMEGNSAAHIKALMTGSSVTVILSEGRIALGTWQGIYFCEYDGPRNRKVHVEIIEKGGNHA